MEQIPSLRHALYRGVFHIIVGSIPAIALLIFPWLVVLVALAAVTIIKRMVLLLL